MLPAKVHCSVFVWAPKKKKRFKSISGNAHHCTIFPPFFHLNQCQSWKVSNIKDSRSTLTHWPTLASQPQKSVRSDFKANSLHSPPGTLLLILRAAFPGGFGQNSPLKVRNCSINLQRGIGQTKATTEQHEGNNQVQADILAYIKRFYFIISL